MQFIYRFFLEQFRFVENLEGYSKLLAAVSTFLIISLIAYLVFVIARKFMLFVVHKVAVRTETVWDDILVENRVFKIIANLLPALIFFYSANFASPDVAINNLEAGAIENLSQDYYLSLESFLLRMSKLYLIGIAVFLFNAILNSILGIYNTTRYAKPAP